MIERTRTEDNSISHVDGSTKNNTTNTKAESSTISRRGGNRNLIILGIGALILTIVSTSISLMLYRVSGDIYLDRSRPGFLPDESEVEIPPQVDSGFSFSDSGSLDSAELDEYLNEFEHLIVELEQYGNAYSPAPLSNQSLGIPSELEEN